MDKLIRDSSTEIGAHSEIMLPLQLTLLLVSQMLAKVQADLQTEKGNFTNLSSPPDFGLNCTASCVVLCDDEKNCFFSLMSNLCYETLKQLLEKEPNINK